MLLQISNIDSLSVSNGQSGILTFYIIVVLGLIGLLLFFFFKKKSKRAKQKKEQLIPYSKQKEATMELQNEIKTKPIISNDPIPEITKEKEVTKVIVKPANVKNPFKVTPKEKVGNITFQVSKSEEAKPDKEEQSKEKYIGYNPINIFTQTEPRNFPYVIMPKPNCVIKFPRKGRVGRKGYKEEDFKIYIEKYFKKCFQVFDDRFLLVKNINKPFEPDFTLIDEKDGINLFLDIEIDEPYEGLNDISKRKPTHYQYSDTNRNSAFKNRGWIILRFAEIQVHQYPISCCRFVADVIKSIYPKFSNSEILNNSIQIQPIKQWTKEEAEVWSSERYREKYLGISSFGITSENTILEELTETELGKKIEEQVEEDTQFFPLSIPKLKTTNSKLDLINLVINSNTYLSFTYNGFSTITKPVRTTYAVMTAFCYVKNQERVFNIYEISNLLQKSNYYTIRVAGPTIGLDKISNVVNTAINYRKHIRMKYTRSSWSNMFVDQETGELILNKIEAEESIRTINDVQLSINVLAQEHLIAYNLDNNYITAYCNKREEQRTFRFDRIGEIEILDI